MGHMTRMAASMAPPRLMRVHRTRRTFLTMAARMARAIGMVKVEMSIVCEMPP